MADDNHENHSHSLVSSNAASHRDPTVRWFWLFAIGHLILWFLVPTLTQPNAPLDTLEMLYWGHEWQWGYFKHPPLPAWIAEASCQLFGRAVWPTYLAAQICVVTCFWAVWKLAREILRPWHALCAAFVLEASYYYNYTTPELNNNVVSRTFWALTILFFHRALSRGKNGWWLLTGISVGLGLLSRYDTFVLIAIMLGFAILHPVARKCWRTAGPYLGLTAGLILVAPHLHWLVTNDFPTVRYFQNRSSGNEGWERHLINPSMFFLTQMGAILPAVLLSAPLISNWRLRKLAKNERFHSDFLLCMALGPFLFILAASATLGFGLKSMWGTALWSYTGALLLYIVPLREDALPSKRVLSLSVATTLVFAVGLTLRNTALPFVRHEGSRIHFSGDQLADQVQERWDQVSDEPLECIGGFPWLASNVAFYSDDRASVYTGLDQNKSPWLSDEEFEQNGGVVLWRESPYEDELLRKLHERFPQAIYEAPIMVHWQSDAQIEDVEVRIAIIPPDADEEEKDVVRTASATASDDSATVR
ncbi:MAG: glycosyltransferase family 39 protein [Thermomicrobiales bacterium]